MRGEDDEDDELLREMAIKADRYIRSFAWCLEVHQGYFAGGIGGILALFLFSLTIRKVENRGWVWVFVGDFPSCYLEFEGFGSPRAALIRFIEGLEEWTSASIGERNSRRDLPPSAYRRAKSTSIC